MAKRKAKNSLKSKISKRIKCQEICLDQEIKLNNVFCSNLLKIIAQYTISEDMMTVEHMKNDVMFSWILYSLAGSNWSAKSNIFGKACQNNLLPQVQRMMNENFVGKFCIFYMDVGYWFSMIERQHLDVIRYLTTTDEILERLRIGWDEFYIFAVRLELLRFIEFAHYHLGMGIYFAAYRATKNLNLDGLKYLSSSLSTSVFHRLKKDCFELLDIKNTPSSKKIKEYINEECEL